MRGWLEFASSSNETWHSALVNSTEKKQTRRGALCSYTRVEMRHRLLFLPSLYLPMQTVLSFSDCMYSLFAAHADSFLFLVVCRLFAMKKTKKQKQKTHRYLDITLQLEFTETLVMK